MGDLDNTAPSSDHELLVALIKKIGEPPAFDTFVTPQANQYAVPVTNARQKLVAVNAARTKLIVQNLSGSVIEIGNDQVVFGQGIQIAAGATFFDDIVPFKGEWYVIANVAGPLDVRVRDESRTTGG